MFTPMLIYRCFTHPWIGAFYRKEIDGQKINEKRLARMSGTTTTNTDPMKFPIAIGALGINDLFIHEKLSLIFY